MIRSLLYKLLINLLGPSPSPCGHVHTSRSIRATVSAMGIVLASSVIECGDLVVCGRATICNAFIGIIVRSLTRSIILSKGKAVEELVKHPFDDVGMTRLRNSLVVVYLWIMFWLHFAAQ